ncbi:MAG: hypothetical protein ABFE13_13645 [Phycisphaerales bacterium]
MRRIAFSHRRASSEARMVLGLVLLLGILFLLIRARGPRPHPNIRQKAQLHSMDAALELFDNEFKHYPPSEANDLTGKPYCGVMKLAEVLMGHDLLGFHSESVFRCDGLDATGMVGLYPNGFDKLDPALRGDNLRARKGPYLQAENAKAFRLVDVYGKGNTGLFPEDVFVLCDTFVQKRPGGKKTGMPILYYKANPLGSAHKAGDPINICNGADNQILVALGVPGQARKLHPLSDPNRFYLNTQDLKSLPAVRPFRPDKFILVSAGWDGLYGTADDVCNFTWKYRER